MNWKTVDSNELFNIEWTKKSHVLIYEHSRHYKRCASIESSDEFLLIPKYISIRVP